MQRLASWRIVQAETVTPRESMRQDVSDEILMQRVAQGDHLAFRLLVERHAARAHAVARRLLFGAPEADDIVQDVYTKLWVHAGRWDGQKARFATWFYRMLVNSCIDYRRKKKPQAGLDMHEMEDGRESAEQALAASQQSDQVRRAMEALPLRQRIAIVLCYYEGLTNQAAAEAMHIHIKALEGLLARGRAALKSSLQSLKRKDAL